MTRLILVALTIGGIWLPSMNTVADERGMSRSLLNIAKRPLPRLTLRGVGLTSKDAVS